MHGHVMGNWNGAAKQCSERFEPWGGVQYAAPVCPHVPHSLGHIVGADTLRCQSVQAAREQRGS